MRTVLVCLFLVACTPIQTRSATNEIARVFDGSGGTASNASFFTFTSAGQPNPIGLSTNTDWRNHSGFLRSFIMFAGLDNDGDGIVDENDPDDDNDGLSDLVELVGGAFQPPTMTDMFATDTDSDGSSDGSEAVSGTNPLDPFNVLEIVSIQESSGSFSVTWKARDGYTYQLLGSTNVESLVSNPSVAGTVLAGGGIPPWFETLAAKTNLSASTRMFYRVRLVP